MMCKCTVEIAWEWKEQCFAAKYVWEFEFLWEFLREVSVIEVVEGVRVVEVLWFKLLKVWELCLVKIFSASESSVRVFYC